MDTRGIASPGDGEARTVCDAYDGPETQAEYEARLDDALIRLPEAPPRRTVLDVSAEQVKSDRETVAVFCAREIRTQARAYARVATPPHVPPRPDEDDDAPLNAMELHRAAVGLQLELIYRMERSGEAFEDGGAVYVPEEDSSESSATVYLSRRTPKRKQRAQIVHEMGHHIQRTRVARALYDADVVTCADLDGAAIRHEIARRVEALVAQTG